MYVLRQYYYEIVHGGDGKNIQGILYRVLYREGCTISTPCTIPSSVYYTLYYHKVHPVLYRTLYYTGICIVQGLQESLYNRIVIS